MAANYKSINFKIYEIMDKLKTLDLETRTKDIEDFKKLLIKLAHKQLEEINDEHIVEEYLMGKIEWFKITAYTGYFNLEKTNVIDFYISLKLLLDKHSKEVMKLYDLYEKFYHNPVALNSVIKSFYNLQFSPKYGIDLIKLDIDPDNKKLLGYSIVQKAYAADYKTYENLLKDINERIDKCDYRKV